MKLSQSFRMRLFAGFLLASLLPLLLCAVMLLQVFRLRLDSQMDSETQGQLSSVTCGWTARWTARPRASSAA